MKASQPIAKSCLFDQEFIWTENIIWSKSFLTQIFPAQIIFWYQQIFLFTNFFSFDSVLFSLALKIMFNILGSMINS